ncbi:hypothetical protein [Flavobacterium kingsejongi]|uniref:Uncharacterized protein n=1 Tax=Flavobacterium kingsejongi TaxID=1678728 RepID=A0A2S1LU02_9FLAO|nr:hypothetical protein [Flavobacterium kingsejongi]AWG27131.1 hypothetical protein FK004_18855 [Flavobacterium kingsejongi]
MACQFTIFYNGSKPDLIEKIRNTIGDKGELIGDEIEGHFEGHTLVGKFTGSYHIELHDIEITITDKPFLISCSKIQEEFEKALQ